MNEPDLTHIDYWDVGQGDCSVLNFSDRSIIMIDTGPKTNPVVGWLAERRPKILAIVLTHNDSDHAGSACSIVKEHKESIRAFFLLEDRPKGDKRFQTLFRCVLEGEKSGHYQLQRAEDGARIWTGPTGMTRLRIVHPSLSGAILANSPNATSAIVTLEHENNLLAIWPGDSTLERVADKVGERSLWILNGPHHGSPGDAKVHPKWEEFVDTIAPARAFISVGTHNQYSHPREAYLRSLTDSGCRTVCSELTRHCDPEMVSSGKPVFQGSGVLGLPASRSGVSCRGTWRAYFRDGRLVPDQYDDHHRERVVFLRRPLCCADRHRK
jgi:beta-lactamase superfamily II metal-dependent hydrolase